MRITSPGGVLGQDEGSTVTASGILNFVGAGVTVTNVGGVLTITIPGGGGSSVPVENEGVEITAAVDLFDFVGAGVHATASGDSVTITVPGGVVDILANRPAAAAANQGMVFYASDVDLLYISDGSTWTTAVLDHGTGLTGLSDDDHPQYVLRSILTTRGDLFTRDGSAIIRLGIGASGRYLRSDGTDPSWAVLSADDVAAGTLSNDRLDADLKAIGNLTRTRGDLIVGGASDWVDLAVGASGRYLRSDGTDPAWSTIQNADLDADLAAIGNLTRTRGDLIVGGASDWVDLAVGANRRALLSDGTDPFWGKVPYVAYIDDGAANITNSAVLTTILDAAPTLQFAAVGDMILFRCVFKFLNNSGANQTLNIQTSFLGSTFMNVTTGNLTSNASYHAVAIVGWLQVRVIGGAAADNIAVGGFCTVGSASVNPWDTAQALTSQFVGGMSTGPATNTSGTFDIKATGSTGTATTTIVPYGTQIIYIPGATT